MSGGVRGRRRKPPPTQSMLKLWTAYQKKFSYAEDISWNSVMGAVKELYGVYRDTEEGVNGSFLNAERAIPIFKCVEH